MAQKGLCLPAGLLESGAGNQCSLVLMGQRGFSTYVTFGQRFPASLPFALTQGRGCHVGIFCLSGSDPAGSRMQADSSVHLTGSLFFLAMVTHFF